MDYSLAKGLSHSNVQGNPRLAILYDIGCHYSVHFRRRVQNSAMFLPFPLDTPTYFGVGAFHISAHVPECFPRFSPQFIPGLGIVDGEILESLWSTLNEVSPSAQTASLAARTELLDDHMLDSNWKKLLNIGMYSSSRSCSISLNPPPQATAVTKKHLKAVEALEESKVYLEGLSKNVDRQTLTAWEAQLTRAQAERLKDVSSMDIFDSKLKSPGS
jgi:hypothetical protein